MASKFFLTVNWHTIYKCGVNFIFYHSIKCLIYFISLTFFGLHFTKVYGQNSNPFLLNVNEKLTVKIKRYDTDKFNYCLSTTVANLHAASTFVKTDSAEWQIKVSILSDNVNKNSRNVAVTFVCKSGYARNVNLTACLNFDNWSVNNYSLMPGAVYNGNRFQWRRITYSPKLLDPKDIGPNMQPIISDVPKLNIGNGPSFIQERSGSMSIPAIGFYEPAKSMGFWLVTDQGNKYGDYGMGIEETKDKTACEISISSPVVRELYKYRITDMRYPSDDIPANFRAGDSLQIHFTIHSVSSPYLQTFIDKFSQLRKEIASKISFVNTLPFSEAFQTIKEKFNNTNYANDFGYYSVGLRENFLQDWQIGWTGGMISTYPLLRSGDADTRARVLRNFDWLFPNGISPSGFFFDSGEKGTKWYGGDIRKPNTENWHLIRKSGDGLYYIIKQFFELKKLGYPLKETWQLGTQGVANAFVRLWKDNGQLGQFVDSRTGKICVGGSTSGAIVPGALCMAYKFYGNKEYLEVASQIAEYYYTNFVKNGLTTGGPGDALQNPDSESCYALIESYVSLYEETGEERWLVYAQDAAKLFSTWVMGYNYNFPANSLFGKLDIHSKGAVFANAQNKHGAPAICTFSGQALLKLFRITGNNLYQELLNDIVHNMPQYLSHPKKPIPNMKWGWMSERVNTTDWLEDIGEIAYITTWAETSMMLVYSEIPGLYVQPDKGFFVSFDNITSDVIKQSPKSLSIRIKNPTPMPAAITVLAENTMDLNKSLDESMRHLSKVVYLRPYESKTLVFSKGK